MSSLSFALFGSNQLAAARQTLASIRRHYPNSYCAIISDCGADYSELVQEFSTEYFYYRRKLSYPTQPYGWRREGVMEFLQRLYFAALRCGTTHIMYVEEDVLIFKPLEIPDEAEIIGFKTCYPDGSRFPNGFSDAFLDMIRDFSGKDSDVTGYGAQGGCVLNVKTYLDNYARIVDFINKNLDYIQDNVYATAGWIDCFLTWYYMLCGKKYTHNTNYLEVNDAFDYGNPPPHAELATHYQGFYVK
jgi:hypothetical protein